MKKKNAMKLAFAACSALALTGGLASCGSASKDDNFNVGVVQLVQHVALDAATKGFKDALQEAMDKAGKMVTFDVKVADGTAPTCKSISEAFVANKVDLIMANATAALQAAYGSTATIPVLGTSITDYATALGIKSGWTGVSGTNVSGTTDLAPIDQQAAEMVKLLKLTSEDTVALLYCSAEANSLYQVNEMAKCLTEAGVKSEKKAFTDSNDITAVCNAIASSGAKAVYIPTDNTAASSTTTINNVFYNANIPVYTGEEGICKGCGFATLSISYESLGRKTGEMAAKILLEKADVSKMAVQSADSVTKEYVKEYCDKFGVTVTSDYVEIPHE